MRTISAASIFTFEIRHVNLSELLKNVDHLDDPFSKIAGMEVCDFCGPTSPTFLHYARKVASIQIPSFIEHV